MQLISLDITNFRVIKKAHLNFPDKVIGLIGPNGAGKSSIIEAIAWALYGNQVARSGKEEIKATYASNEEDCQISLEFSVNDEKYKVVRRLIGKNERAEVELFRGEDSESVGVKETKTYIGQLLGLDWRGFLSSFLARQQELNALSDLQPSKRRDHIAGMLGIERLDKAIQKVKEDTRIYQEKVALLTHQLEERKRVAQQIEILSEKITNLDEPVEILKKDYKELSSKFKEIYKAYEIIQQKQNRWVEYKVRKDAEEKTLGNLLAQQKKLIKEKQKLLNAKSESDKLTIQLIELPTIKKKLEQLRESKNSVVRRNQLTEQKQELLNEQENFRSTLRKTEEKFVLIENKWQTFDVNLEQLFQNEQQKLEQARNDYSRLKSEKNSLLKEINKLKKQLGDISQLGPDSVCDRCLRPFGKDYHQIKEHLKKELQKLEDDIKQKENELTNRKEAGKNIKLNVDALEKKIKERYQLQLEREGFKKDRTHLQQQIETHKKKVNQINGQLERYKDLRYDSQEFEALNVKYDELEKLQQKYNRIKGSLDRLLVVEENLIEFKDKIVSTQNNIDKYGKEIKKIDFKEEDFNKTKNSYLQIQNEMEESKDKYLSVLKEKELTEKELEGKREQLNNFQKTEKELEQYRTDHFYGEKLSYLLTDFRKDLIASIRPSLAELSSQLFEEMTDGKYNLVELDENYNLKIMDSGAYFNVERFSGGEKDLANLCLRLAISLALTESAGLNRSFVILDEVFGSQDNNRKELILKALAKLKNRFPQILLVSHVEDIKNGVEEVIEVYPTGNGWSEVRVNGVSQV